MKVPSATIASTNQLKSRSRELKSDDFIKMMLTQLQNQDPMKPASNEELMGQMAQISSLQSNTMLQETLKDMGMQSQIGAAGNLIGKTVQGLDENNKQVDGVVSSVRVRENKVYLELENGKTVLLGNVTAIAAAPAPPAGTTGAAVAS